MKFMRLEMTNCLTSYPNTFWEAFLWTTLISLEKGRSLLFISGVAFLSDFDSNSTLSLLTFDGMLKSNFFFVWFNWDRVHICLFLFITGVNLVPILSLSLTIFLFLIMKLGFELFWLIFNGRFREVNFPRSKLVELWCLESNVFTIELSHLMKFVRSQLSSYLISVKPSLLQLSIWFKFHKLSCSWLSLIFIFDFWSLH